MKRFAKIGGEMVSLAVVENCASALWPDNMHAAVAVADGRKGEQIILVTDAKEANRAELLAWAQNHGVPELSIPKKIVLVEQVPILGTGKTDYPNVAKVANERLAHDRGQGGGIGPAGGSNRTPHLNRNSVTSAFKPKLRNETAN